jgi:hypothetical protein
MTNNRYKGLEGQRFSLKFVHRSHTNLAMAEEPWSGFRRCTSIPAPPSSIAGILRHLYPLSSLFRYKSSLVAEYFDKATEIWLDSG